MASSTRLFATRNDLYNDKTNTTTATQLATVRTGIGVVNNVKKDHHVRNPAHYTATAKLLFIIFTNTRPNCVEPRNDISIIMQNFE
jgi:hypothetical protein